MLALDDMNVKRHWSQTLISKI